MFAIKDWSKSLGQPGASLRAAQEPSGRTVQRSKSVRHWDFLKSPSKISGLLTPKFPSGLRGALLLVRHPASANFPWDGWAVQVANQSPYRLSLIVMEAIRVVIAVRLLMVVIVAIRYDSVRLRRLSFLLC